MDTINPTQTQEGDIIHSTRIGIIGGGQLGLMLSEAARAMGFASVTVLDPTPQCPASSVADQIIGSLKDPQSLRLLAEQSNIQRLWLYRITFKLTTSFLTNPALLGNRNHFVKMGYDWHL